MQYKGSGPAIADLMAGTIDGVIDQTVTMLPLHQSRRVKAIAVASPRRLAQMPDIPTFAEGGLPEFDLTIWNGLFAPKGTPRAVVNALSEAISKVLDSPEYKARMDQLAAQIPVTGRARAGRVRRHREGRPGTLRRAGAGGRVAGPMTARAPGAAGPAPGAAPKACAHTRSCPSAMRGGRRVRSACPSSAAERNLLFVYASPQGGRQRVAGESPLPRGGVEVVRGKSWRTSSNRPATSPC